MNPAWFLRHDSPMDWEIARRSSLMQAIQNLPGGGALDEENVERKALFLWRASHWGRNEELPRNRPASQKRTDDELRKLAQLAEKLADHIEGMHRPAISALYAEGANVFTLAKQLRSLQEEARHAFSSAEPDEKAGGAPPKAEAAEVAITAGLVFEGVTGRRPTFTTDPASGAVSGIWPEFLAQVFDALLIKASVAAQARAASEKTTPEIGS